jgi:hypothetical protein
MSLQETSMDPLLDPSPKNARKAPDANFKSLGGIVVIPLWLKGLSFFLSAFLFLSSFVVAIVPNPLNFLSFFLLLLAPLPLLFSFVWIGQKWAWLAALTNAAIVAFFGGGLSFVIYFVFIFVLSIVLSELLKVTKSVEKSVAGTFLMMLVSAAIFGLIVSRVLHLNVIQEIYQYASHIADYVGQSILMKSNLLNAMEIDEWKQAFLIQIPSALAIFSLILIIVNVFLLLKINPSGIRESLGLNSTYFKEWRAPEFLVWPTIFVGTFLVIHVGIASDVALNLFKFIMTIYVIQGLCILSYFFDLWGVRRFFRWTGFLVSLLLMIPLVLSLGFFDLWFDFRGKFRQS